MEKFKKHPQNTISHSKRVGDNTERNEIMKNFVVILLLLLCFSGCSSMLKQNENNQSNSVIQEDTSTSTSSNMTSDYDIPVVTENDVESFSTTSEAIQQVEFYGQYANFEEFSDYQELIEKTNLDILIWIAPELYNEVGEEALIANGNFFEVPIDIANRYLYKYFGVENYDPNIYLNYSADTKCFNIPTSYGGPSFKVCQVEVHSIKDNFITYKCVFYKSIFDDNPKYQSSLITTELLPDEYPFLRLISVSSISPEFDSFEEAVK